MAEDNNVVFVGKKGLMSYVLAVITQFNQGAKVVHIKARGRAISKAVDVAEVIKNKYFPDAKYGKIEISTEEVKTEDGQTRRFSAIDIELVRG